jgi:hypothetical protein
MIPRQLACALREIAHPDARSEPCPACGCRVWFRLAHTGPWGCRDCDHRRLLSGGWRAVRWCVVPEVARAGLAP